MKFRRIRLFVPTPLPLVPSKKFFNDAKISDVCRIVEIFAMNLIQPLIEGLRAVKTWIFTSDCRYELQVMSFNLTAIVILSALYRSWTFFFSGGVNSLSLLYFWVADGSKYSTWAKVDIEVELELNLSLQ